MVRASIRRHLLPVKVPGLGFSTAALHWGKLLLSGGIRGQFLLHNRLLMQRRGVSGPGHTRPSKSCGLAPPRHEGE